MQQRSRMFRVKQITQDSHNSATSATSKASVPAWKVHALDVLMTSSKQTRAPGNGPHRNEGSHFTRYPAPGSSNDWHKPINNNLNFTKTKTNSKASRIQAMKAQMDRATKATSKSVQDAKWIHLWTP